MRKLEEMTDRKEPFVNYGKSEIDDLLWEMYKGWFLHNATDIDTDKIIDMMLFYDELRGVISRIDPEENRGPSNIVNIAPSATEKDTEQL